MAERDFTADLPPELLTMALNPCDNEDVMRAAQVSHRWRDAASNCDAFYISIKLDLEFDDSYEIAPCPSIDMCELSITTSTAPLQIRIAIEVYPLSVVFSNRALMPDSSYARTMSTADR